MLAKQQVKCIVFDSVTGLAKLFTLHNANTISFTGNLIKSVRFSTKQSGNKRLNCVIYSIKSHQKNCKQNKETRLHARVSNLDCL